MRPTGPLLRARDLLPPPPHQRRLPRLQLLRQLRRLLLRREGVQARRHQASNRGWEEVNVVLIERGFVGKNMKLIARMLFNKMLRLLEKRQ